MAVLQQRRRGVDNENIQPTTRRRVSVHPLSANKLNDMSPQLQMGHFNDDICPVPVYANRLLCGGGSALHTSLLSSSGAIHPPAAATTRTRNATRHANKQTITISLFSSAIRISLPLSSSSCHYTATRPSFARPSVRGGAPKRPVLGNNNISHAENRLQVCRH